jgi:hypothetical protein
MIAAHLSGPSTDPGSIKLDSPAHSIDFNMGTGHPLLQYTLNNNQCSNSDAAYAVRGCTTTNTPIREPMHSQRLSTATAIPDPPEREGPQILSFNVWTLDELRHLWAGSK